MFFPKPYYALKLTHQIVIQSGGVWKRGRRENQLDQLGRKGYTMWHANLLMSLSCWQDEPRSFWVSVWQQMFYIENWQGSVWKISLKCPVLQITPGPNISGVQHTTCCSICHPSLIELFSPPVSAGHIFPSFDYRQNKLFKVCFDLQSLDYKMAASRRFKFWSSREDALP